MESPRAVVVGGVEITGFCPGDVGTAPKAFDACKSISRDFVVWAQAKGLDVHWVQLLGSPDHPRAYRLWRSVPARSRIHYVAKIGRVYVDWTARQFDPDAPVPAVAETSDWDEEYDITDALV